MTTDDELHAELKADAETLETDAAAILAEIESERWSRKLAEVAADLFAFGEPMLVALAAAEGGPIAGGAAKIVGDKLATKLRELAAAKKA